MKGIYKGFKYISQIFVVKEREMEIGYPTDVKHVAHIGWDGQSGSAPSWMKEFKTASDFAATSISNVGTPSNDPNSIVVSTWSAQDYEQPIGRQLSSGICRGSPQADRPKPSKKHKRKKIKSAASSPKSVSLMSRSSRASTKSKPLFAAAVAEVETRSKLLTVVP